MLSNNAGDQIAPAAEAAQAAGTKVVTWDSPIPSGEGEGVFVAQVDFGSIGVVMADMAIRSCGGAGEIAVLSATPGRREPERLDRRDEGGAGRRRQVRRTSKLVDVVYGDDQSEVSYNRALALVDKYPDLKADHVADHGRHRGRGQGDAGRRAVRQGQGLGPWPAGGNGQLHDERLRAGIRAVGLPSTSAT